MTDRVALFVDYQNVYSSARRVFHDNRGPGRLGQIWPLAVGDLLCTRTQPSTDRRLEQVRVYRGVPSSAQSRTGYAAARRQIAAWRDTPNVEVLTHTLQRLPGGALREKRVDVHLAADLVDRAHRDLFDIAIVFSLDSDFKPAIEIVRDLGVIVEVAAWRPGRGEPNRRLSDGGMALWCHWLDADDYRRVRDTVSYAQLQPGS